MNETDQTSGLAVLDALLARLRGMSPDEMWLEHELQAPITASLKVVRRVPQS